MAHLELPGLGSMPFVHLNMRGALFDRHVAMTLLERPGTSFNTWSIVHLLVHRSERYPRTAK